MQFTKDQYGKLSDLFLDLAKVMFVAAFVVPLAAARLVLVNSLWSIFVGLFFTYLSLMFTKRKEEYEY